MPAGRLTIRGLSETLAKLDARPFLGEPLRAAHEDVGRMLAPEARRRAPKDEGRLAASIDYRIDPAPVPRFLVVETRDVQHARPMEYGTGTRSDAPDSSRQPHFPPPSALEGWARRHGLPNGYVVARAIFRRGGLAPRRYMRGALEALVGQIRARYGRVPGEVAARWRR